MAYADRRDPLELPLRTLRRTADFSGRSQRTEVVCYVIAWYALSLLVGFGVSLLSTFDSPYWAEALRDLLVVPMVALLVRRLHDQGRPGWPALILPLIVLLDFVDIVRWTQWDANRLIAYQASGPHPLQWAEGVLSLATLVLFLLPGTEGPNRYGEDPRLVEG
jgi:uncharacterized membrane protein YhaH (DUF805 family)